MTPMTSQHTAIFLKCKHTIFKNDLNPSIRNESHSNGPTGAENLREVTTLDALEYYAGCNGMHFEENVLEEGREESEVAG